MRDTAGVIGSLKHEGYVPNAEDDAAHRCGDLRGLSGLALLHFDFPSDSTLSENGNGSLGRDIAALVSHIGDLGAAHRGGSTDE